VLIGIALLGASGRDALSASQVKNQSTPRKAVRRPAAKPAQPAKEAAPAAAPGELKEFPVSALSVEGNRAYPVDAILRVAQVKIGDPARKDLFEAARDRLLATGAFDSVGYRYFTASDGVSYEAVFQLEEAFPMYPFRVEDLPAGVPDVQKWLRDNDPLSGPKIPATRIKIERYASLIQQLAGKAGFSGQITGKVEADAPEKLLIVFRPAGVSPVVAEVRFQGNQAIPETVLRQAILGVALGVRFQEARFRQLLETSVRPVYEERGRLGVSFGEVKTERSTQVNGLNVRVTLTEGPIFELGEIKLAGPDGLREAELMAAAALKPGEAANMTAVQEGIERMRQSLRRAGYMMAVLTPERTLDADAKRVRIKILADPGSLYAFRRLLVRGLDIETEPVIRKLWTMKEGQPFNPDYPDQFLQRVRDGGIFDNLGKTRSSIAIHQAEKTVDVTLEFGGAAERQSILKKQ
jgi:outer membrane protein assembly factor BamA